MSLSRRQFVYAASLSVVAASASPSLFAQSGSQTAPDTVTDDGSATLATFSLGDFEGLIGASFSISLAGRSLGNVTLIAATAAVPPHGAKTLPGQALEGFSLRLSGRGRNAAAGHLPDGGEQSRHFPTVSCAGGSGGIWSSYLHGSLHKVCRLCFKCAGRPVGMTRLAK